MKNINLILLFLFSFVLKINAKADINWEKYLESYDMVWEQLPLQWNEGAFVGNGLLGMMIYGDSTENSIIFHIGRSDVTDHKKAPFKKSSVGVKGASVHYDFCRLDVGQMRLKINSKILSTTLRQSLWNAEITGIIKTSDGILKIKAYTLYDYMVNVVEVEGDSSLYKWIFKPGDPRSARIHIFRGNSNKVNYKANPFPSVYYKGTEGWCVQQLEAGGDYATVWKEFKSGSEKRSIYFSTANEVPKTGVSINVARKDIAEAEMLGKKAVENMRNWWHHFYMKSFISIPDKQMESFYWIQIYKMATCSRSDAPPMDNFGTFYKRSQWLGLWTNLNVQLAYWLPNSTNHLEMGYNLEKYLDDHLLDFVHNNGGYVNVGDKSVLRCKILSDYTWLLHNLYLHYRFNGDNKSIYNKIIPWSREILSVYKNHFKEEDGIINIIDMVSPEYKGFTLYKNANYNLMLLNWMLQTMIEYSVYGEVANDELTEWKRILSKLSPFPVNEYGYMISSDQSFDMSHRHYSHLLGLYPLYILNPEEKKVQQLIEKSIDRWLSIGSDKTDLCGYSYTGAAALYSALGNGNKAWKALNNFLNRTGPCRGTFLSNTMYTETGALYVDKGTDKYIDGEGLNPTLETPLSGACALTEFMLQSWGGKIRLFPAMPSDWKNSCFSTLRAQGGFLVSASYKNGKTEWVTIKSLVGEKCILKVIGWSKPVSVGRSKDIKITSIGKDEFSIDLKKGESVTLATHNGANPRIIPIECPSNKNNLFGLKTGKGLAKYMTFPEDSSFKYNEYIIK